ncbi:hypothetical protein Tco_1220376 [Tanacetum coccineum]
MWRKRCRNSLNEASIYRFMMDDPNITMEEYIKLQAEKAQRRGQTFNWETATYGKIYCDNLDFFTDFEADFLGIVYNDALTSNENVSLEPTVNDHIEINIELCSENVDIKPMDSVDCISNDTTPIESNEHIETNHNKKSELSKTILVFTSHAWRRLFEIQGPLVREFMLEFFSTCMMIDTELRLDEGNTLCFQLGGARRRMTWREFILALGDLRDYWTVISFDRDFLGVAPSYTYIRDPVRRLCHRSAEGRKSGARFSGVYFIGRLIAHFGMVSDEGLIGLIVIAREPLMIDIDDLVKLNICIRLNDTWAWVASGLERQPVAAAGAQRLEEKVHGLHSDMVEQREVLDSMSHDFARFTTWTRRRVRQRTGEASTSAALLKEDQPDP